MHALLQLGKSRMDRLKHDRSPLHEERAPHVTIVVPAKDEGAKIRECIAAAMAQDYPAIDLIAIDDRSTDETGQVLDQLASEYPQKVRTIHIPNGPLPAGWV